jgi:branched-subunit amino acid transport protein
VAGVALLSALVVRSVVLHEDPSLPGAPVVAGLSTGLGLLLAFRGRSTLVAVAAGAATYLALAAAVAATT